MAERVVINTSDYGRQGRNQHLIMAERVGISAFVNSTFPGSFSFILCTILYRHKIALVMNSAWDFMAYVSP